MALANNSLPPSTADQTADTRLNSTNGSPSRAETANDSQTAIRKSEKKIDPYTQMLID